MSDGGQVSQVRPWKGQAAHFHIAERGGLIENAAWSYEVPDPAVSAIREHIASYPDKATVERI